MVALKPPSIARRLQHSVVMNGWGAEGARAASRVWFALVQIHISPEMQNMVPPPASVPVSEARLSIQSIGG